VRLEPPCGLGGINGRIDRVLQNLVSIRLLIGSQRGLAAIATGTTPSRASGSDPDAPRTIRTTASRARFFAS
jgi:hypothetical protein